MAQVVFLRAVNVGGANLCRPAELAKQLTKFDVVNIGAVGTFVVRQPIRESILREAIAKKLPFKCEIMIVPARDVLNLADNNPFARQPAGPEITRFVSVLAKRVAALPPLPVSLPSKTDWLLRIITIENRFVIGIYRRDMKAIGYLGKIEKLLGMPVTTRSWSTIEKVVKILREEQPKAMPRCPWASTEPNITYHDKEWGVPVHDDRKLFEFLILEGAQAGLSWTTILNKRANYRKAFDGFRAERIARYGPRDVKRLLSNPGIVRNRLKIAATINNAKRFLAVQKEFGSFDAYLWSFVGDKTLQNRRRKMADVPARTPESDAMSRDLLRRGFKFVGSTICYALMQATGMVNDHLTTCPRHAELTAA